MQKVVRPWGKFVTLIQTGKFWLKYIKVNRDARTSWQSHNGRVEFVLRSPFLFTRRNELHSLTKGRYIEIAFGSPMEGDIERIQDDYRRDNVETGVGIISNSPLLDHVIYTKQAGTSKPEKWTRRGKCPSCRRAKGHRHKPTCQLVYVRN